MRAGVPQLGSVECGQLPLLSDPRRWVLHSLRVLHALAARIGLHHQGEGLQRPMHAVAAAALTSADAAAFAAATLTSAPAARRPLQARHVGHLHRQRRRRLLPGWQLQGASSGPVLNPRPSPLAQTLTPHPHPQPQP